jgi:hypothetical protein
MESIGDFAEKLILNQVGGIREGKEPLPNQSSNLAPAGKDISNVKVPDSFMKEILGESFHPQETPAVEEIPELVWEQPEEPKAPQSLTEETGQQLLPLLEEVRNLLKEMTTAGMLGVNMAGPGNTKTSWEKVEKGYGYKPSLLPGTSRKNVLKQSIRAKLKNRK